MKTRPLTDLGKKQRDPREIEWINQHAEELNREVEDVLQYQIPLEELGEE